MLVLVNYCYTVQVFHSLLKAHALEARAIVRQALEILTPVVPIRMEDANVSVMVFLLIHTSLLVCKYHSGHIGPLD